MASDLYTCRQHPHFAASYELEGAGSMDGHASHQGKVGNFLNESFISIHESVWALAFFLPFVTCGIFRIPARTHHRQYATHVRYDKDNQIL